MLGKKSLYDKGLAGKGPLTINRTYINASEVAKICAYWVYKENYTASKERTKKDKKTGAD